MKFWNFIILRIKQYLRWIKNQRIKLGEMYAYMEEHNKQARKLTKQDYINFLKGIKDVIAALAGLGAGCGCLIILLILLLNLVIGVITGEIVISSTTIIIILLILILLK